MAPSSFTLNQLWGERKPFRVHLWHKYNIILDDAIYVGFGIQSLHSSSCW